VHQQHECIPLASRIRQEGLQEFWSIGYEIFKFAVDGVYIEDSVFSDVGVTMFQAGAADRDQWFEEFSVFGDILEETEATDRISDDEVSKCAVM
jgi:hypothetical protein